MTVDLTEQLLKYVDEHGQVDTLDLVPVFGVDHQKIVGALKSIQATGDLLNAEPTSRKTWELTDEGKSVLDNGSHEAGVFGAVPSEGGISQADLLKVSNVLFVYCINKMMQFCESPHHFRFIISRRLPRMQKLGLARPWHTAGFCWINRGINR